MKYLLNSQQMKNWEKEMMEKYYTPSILLMERAALAVTEELLNGTYDLHKVLIFCGTGNNGGDGLAVARLLTMKQISVEVLIVGDPERMTAETKQQLQMYQAVSGKFVTREDWDEYTVIVDAVFGIGCNRPLTGGAAEAVRVMNEAKAPVVSVDVPSGVSCDTGEICGTAVQAEKTVTFFMEKLGMMCYPGRTCCGKIQVADLGIPVKPQEGCGVLRYEEEDVQKLPKRAGDSHKGTYGKVLVIAGSPKISGAAYLASAGAYRIGAGLVKVYTPEENRTALQTLLPEALLEIYDWKNPEFEVLSQCMEWADVAVIGPGLGTDSTAERILEYVMTNSRIPLVIDADGLNMIAKNKTMLECIRVPAVLTPHIQEMARLTGWSREELKKAPLEKAKEFTEIYPVTLVMKDAATVVAKSQEDCYLNTSGNAGMAAGGSGDVLAGMLGGLMAQGMSDLEAARLGVYLHGKAGDAAAAKKGMYSMTATDIIDGIAEVTGI